MTQFNVHEAKTNLSALLERVEAGEEIVIARAGVPVARLIAAAPATTPRVLGQFVGQPFCIADDFDALPDDIAAAFSGDAL